MAARPRVAVFGARSRRGPEAQLGPGVVVDEHASTGSAGPDLASPATSSAGDRPARPRRARPSRPCTARRRRRPRRTRGARRSTSTRCRAGSSSTTSPPGVPQCGHAGIAREAGGGAHARAPLHEHPVRAQAVPVEARSPRRRPAARARAPLRAPPSAALEPRRALLGERRRPSGASSRREAVVGVALALEAQAGVDAAVLGPDRVQHLPSRWPPRAGSSSRSRRARSRPASSSPSSSTTRLTSPHSTASSASRKRPRRSARRPARGRSRAAAA